MDIKWDLYNSKLTVHGETRRDRAIYETQHSIAKRSKYSPAYKTVLIDGIEQQVVITSKQMQLIAVFNYILIII